MKQPKVTVIIPLYNDADTITDVLEALAAQQNAPPFDVIVVDDGSQDDGPDRVADMAQLVRQENAGPAAARNRGGAEARGEILLFLDADCIAPPNWVADMAAAFATPEVDAVMGTIHAANDGVVPRLVQLEIDERYDSMSAADRVDFIAAPSCGFRREIFGELGGFDQSLRFGEDVEIAYRLTATGGRIAFVNSAPVAHKHQETWAEFLTTKYRRAIGRLHVFSIHPAKMKQDSWTPLTFKLQFLSVALCVPSLVLALIFGAEFLGLGIALLIAAVVLGWPLVRRSTDRLQDLTGAVRARAIGAGYVILRSALILAALVRFKFGMGR